MFEGRTNMPHVIVKLYSTLKTWSLGPGQSSMALPVQVQTILEYWSFGVLESWQKRKPEFSLHYFFHYSITPADCRKGERLWKPPQGAVQSRVLWVRILYLVV
jgi:hypothetical protein